MPNDHKTPAVISQPTVPTPVLDHQPDDIDREIFSRLDVTHREVHDIRAAQDLLLERNEQLYNMMLSVVEEQRRLSVTTSSLARLVYEDAQASLPIEDDTEYTAQDIPQNDRVSYGTDGLTRRATPLPPITVRNWDNVGVKIRVTRKVWDEAGMPIHEGSVVVVEPHADFFVIRAAVEGDKGIGIWRINEQSVHLKTKSFTTTSSHNPTIRVVKGGSIVVERN